MTSSRLIQVLRFEGLLAGVVWRSRTCLGSKMALAVGLGYMLSPWDLIPDRVPVFGHADELGFALAGVAAARLLVPSRLEQHLAQLGCFAPAAPAHARARLIASWLLLRRRARRLTIHAMRFALRARARWLCAAGTHDVGDFCFSLLGYRLWWCLRSPFAIRRSDTRCLIVIGGAARSGTTLLRSILGRHELIATGPETTVFLRRISSPETIAERIGYDAAAVRQWQRDSRSQVEFIETVRRAVLVRADKPIWAEKTPKNAERFRFVRRRFPHAKIVHIVRDGRDVVCSLRRTPFAKLDHAAADSVAAARRCAVQWWTSVRAGLRLRGDPEYFELRYEALVRDPEPVLRALVGFLGVPWDDRLLQPLLQGAADPEEAAAAGEIFGASVGRWRRELSHADRLALRPLIGPQLAQLGYAAGNADDPIDAIEPHRALAVPAASTSVSLELRLAARAPVSAAGPHRSPHRAAPLHGTGSDGVS